MLLHALIPGSGKVGSNSQTRVPCKGTASAGCLNKGGVNMFKQVVVARPCA